MQQDRKQKTAAKHKLHTYTEKQIEQNTTKHK